ncbi:MAG: hypothetical protein IKX00_02580 [Bacilli bacterium]|nr:hypothetical protein [Bacilli bacterium]
METKGDITPSVNHIIKEARKEKIINSKEIKVDYHTVRELYTRIQSLFRFCTAVCPELAFKSLKHYDEDNDSIDKFNDDFIVGIYTPKGPISFHFKLIYLDKYNHIDFIDRAPLYDGYNEEEMIDRLETLTNYICSGKTTNEIIDEIINNPNLHESQKPSRVRK